ncbi:major facilitator superfamily domain-containing protein [Dactylonectria macrodidyma]|uniref:Major facilitator superfamily domain-containing protein n=1 Tax=Dactylonectria macrodidyma TaxID=307937 RepID=A0A9P9EZ80_9HYPO|nr:major facilitator superfamily domain-containing protein [Dactylonectria macrodidyma]
MGVHAPREYADALSTEIASSMSGMTLIQGAIAAELKTYDADTMWFSSAYLIPMSSLAPLAGRLATIFPPRNLILLVGVLLSAGNGLCASANSFAVFVAGRVVTGVGGAGVLTLAVILGLELTSERTRGVVIGCINACFTTGVSIGAIVYGGLMPFIGWRPLFWIQTPLALLAGLGVYMSLPSTVELGAANGDSWKRKFTRIDYLGAVLLALTIVLFLYGLVGDIRPLPILLSAVSLILFLGVEYRLAAEPIIPIKVLSSRGALFSCLAQLALMSARWSVLFYGPVFMLAVRGAAPAVAGSILIPTNLGFGIGGIVVGWLHVRRSGAFWLPSIVSMVLFSVSLYALSVVATPSVPVELFIVIVLANGLATGAGLNYTLAHLLHLSHEDTRYITTSLLGTFRGFGGSFGTAIGGGVFYRLLRNELVSGYLKLDGGHQLSEERRKLISKLLGTPGLVFGGGLDDADRLVAVDGYAGASRGVWRAAAALGIAMIAIQAATGWTAPQEEGYDEIGQEEARAIVTETEGVGEA